MTHGFEVETIVVDNHSVDGSTFAIKQNYPWVKLIENQENLGFGKANNQGFALASGNYVLALNPDTILQEDTLQLCWQYMENHSECGVLGVKMIDGSGAYLPESKRVFQACGMLLQIQRADRPFSKIFLFASYYMGHLDADSIHEVEVLCGAFYVFQSICPEIAAWLFDEDFFMYGEDIDLSIRIKKRGGKWCIFLLPESSISKGKFQESKLQLHPPFFISRCRSLLANTTPVGRAQRSNFSFGWPFLSLPL